WAYIGRAAGLVLPIYIYSMCVPNEERVQNVITVYKYSTVCQIAVHFFDFLVEGLDKNYSRGDN
ncbi:MAG: hypothetical protein RSD68_07395, partial [Oscillospiraceae bacterium]